MAARPEPGGWTRQAIKEEFVKESDKKKKLSVNIYLRGPNMRPTILLLAVVAAAAAVQIQAASSAGTYSRFSCACKSYYQSCFYFSVSVSVDRDSIIAQAIAEAKEHGQRQSLSREASRQAMKNGQLSSGQVVGRLFKKPSKLAVKQGEARFMFEDMVHRAERKLAEEQRKSHAQVQSAEARAEELADELFHKPGSKLTEKEIALMFQESGCVTVREEPDCTDPIVRVVRTIDGTCNNLREPILGASSTEFRRMINAEYADGVDSLRGGLQARNSPLVGGFGAFVPPVPSARLISKTISFRNNSDEEQPFTHILMQWGQFLDHDMDLSPELEPVPECEDCEFTEVCEPIPVVEDDPAFGVGTLQNGNCLRFARSLPSCGMGRPGELPPREQLNDITSFIDASQVYGSNEVVGTAVRKFEDGLLLEGKNFPGNKPTLPIDKDDNVACLNAEDCFLAGDARANEQISLTIMHTLWFREHNRLARELKRINPFWNDERLFQEARKIVGALIQKITYDDYLPKVLGQATFDKIIGPYTEYDPRLNPGIPNSFATAAYRYGHSLVRPAFNRLGSDFLSIGKGPLQLVDAFFNPDQFKMSMGTDPITRGLVTDNALKYDAFLNSVLTTQLFAGKNRAGMDLAALNIQRGRDHGLPPYLTWVSFCDRLFPNLGVAPEFEGQLNLVRFLQLYGSLDTVDLWIAGLAEKRLPGAFFGATFACIFGDTFLNVRDGDRFWHEKAGVFTPRQLAEIKKGTLSRIICDNSDNINDIQRDAFLGNQRRINCRNIPSVSLEPWRETPCFARVQVMPINSALLLSVFSRVAVQQISFLTQQFQASQQNQFECMPVSCPLQSEETFVLFTTDNPASIVPNELLSPNLNRRNSRYRAEWPRAIFDSQNTGVFTSLANCRRSNNVALTFSMRAREQGLDTVDRLEQQQNEEQEETPEEVENELNKFFGDGGAKETSAVPSTGTVEAEEMVSDQALASQLEQALKDLAL